jgi:hypothetical protein
VKWIIFNLDFPRLRNIVDIADTQFTYAGIAPHACIVEEDGGGGNFRLLKLLHGSFEFLFIVFVFAGKGMRYYYIFSTALMSNGSCWKFIIHRQSNEISVWLLLHCIFILSFRRFHDVVGGYGGMH